VCPFRVGDVYCIYYYLLFAPMVADPQHDERAQRGAGAQRLSEILSCVREETAACNATHARGGG
jgi:hypothetical protein